MDFVFFIYGLSFLVMGLVIVILIIRNNESHQELSGILWLLAAFAFVHGLQEWIDLWRSVGGVYPGMAEARPFLLLLSNLFLFEFGRRLMLISVSGMAPEKIIHLLLGYWIYIPLLGGIIWGTSLADQPLLAMKIWSRYLAGFFSFILTGAGLLLYVHSRFKSTQPNSKHNLLRIGSKFSAGAFFAYAILNGLITPRADFFPASVINQETFLEVFHFPVQILRMTCAIVISASIWGLLGFFRSEESRLLQDAFDEIQHSHTRLEFLVTACPATIYTCSVSPPFGATYISPNIKWMMGYHAEQFTEHSEFWTENIHPEDRQQVIGDLPQLFENDVLHHEYRFRMNNGNYRWIYDERRVVRDETGKATEIIGYFVDITKRKLAESALLIKEERLNLATSAGHIGIWDWDIVNNKLIWDDSMYALYGLCKEEFRGDYEAWSSTLHPADRQFAEGEIQASLRGEREYKPEFRIVRPDGSVRHIKSASKTFFDPQGKPLRMVGINADISETKQAQEQLLLLNETLAQQVSEQTQQNVKQERLMIEQSRSAVMGEMMRNIAHQWRQPLNGVGLVVQNIRDDFRDNRLTNEGMDKDIGTAMRCLNQMSNTINDFRDFFRPDKEKKHFKLHQAIDESLSLIDATLKNHRIEVSLFGDLELQTFGHRNEFSQVILNLLANAKDALIDNHIVNGKIDIELKSSAQAGIVVIRDNAGGIAEEAMGKIFEPYFTTKISGSGIGLYMSRIIIEKYMNGSITYRNIADGAEFTVSIPAMECIQ